MSINFDSWKQQVWTRSVGTLDKYYEYRDKLFYTTLNTDNVIIPKAVWNESSIGYDDFVNVASEMFQDNIDDILRETTDLLLQEVFNKSPVRKQVERLCRHSGISIPHIFLDITQRLLRVEVNIKDLLNRSNIKPINLPDTIVLHVEATAYLKGDRSVLSI